MARKFMIRDIPLTIDEMMARENKVNPRPLDIKEVKEKAYV